MRILTFMFLIFVFISCTENQNKSPLNNILNHKNIQSQFFNIDIRKDTTILTLGGATILIPKDGIKADNEANIVTIELKEAYTIEEMVRAGLTTKSGRQILSSGGMIYINAKAARIQNNISIKIPSTNYKAEMQLFKGKADEFDRVDWQAPEPLQTNTTLDSNKYGKQIFLNNCSSCHHLTKDATGPHLAFLPQRREKEWLNKKIRNSMALIASGDGLANCLYEKWNKVAMTSFPNLSDGDLEALYKYLNEESKTLNPDDYPDFQASLDSCKMYYKAKYELEGKLHKLKADNGTEAIKIKGSISVEQVVPSPNLVKPKYEQATFYQFTISTFGWYNVDAFSTDLPGFEPSELKVKINNRLEDVYNIYLILPEDKVCSDGGLLKDEKHWYGF